MKQIKLSNCDEYTLVDDEDYEKLKGYTWAKAKGYARAYYKPRVYILMHKMLMQPPKGMEVDHKDGNKLNNCRSNLRVVTHAQNMQNRRIGQVNKSGYKGVCWDKTAKTWCVRVWKDGGNVFHAHKKDLIEAAKLYNKHAVIHFGEFAKLNDI